MNGKLKTHMRKSSAVILFAFSFLLAVNANSKVSQSQEYKQWCDNAAAEHLQQCSDATQALKDGSMSSSECMNTCRLTEDLNQCMDDGDFSHSMNLALFALSYNPVGTGSRNLYTECGLPGTPEMKNLNRGGGSF